MALTFEQDTLASLLEEQRRTNELLEALLDALAPSPEEEPSAAPPSLRQKVKCAACKATYVRVDGTADPCPRCGADNPASKKGEKGA
jgi:Zn finger protein HypA/HybF involved in hydrogenase expression